MRFLTAAVLLAASVTFAMEVSAGNNDLKLNLIVGLQARAVGSWDGDRRTAGSGGAPNGTYDTDFYIRRAILVASGSAYEHFTFFVLLDSPYFGIRGNYADSTLVQDLHIGYVPARDVDIEVGFLYMPLSHLAMNLALSTSSIEKNSAVLFFNNSRGQRETGAQVRALLFDHRILVRGGLYEGLHGDPQSTNAITAGVNPNGRPLVAGMLRLNLIGDETGYAYPSLYIDGKSRLSIGVGGQFQTKGSNTPVTSASVNPATGLRNAPVPTAVNDYVALAADVFADIALPGDTEFAIQADIYRFDWGAGSDKTGYATTFELGYRVGPIEPEVNGYWFNSDSRQNSFFKVAGGLNYFLRKHQAKLSMEFWSTKSGVDLRSASALHQIVFQAQAFF